MLHNHCHIEIERHECSLCLILFVFHHFISYLIVRCDNIPQSYSGIPRRGIKFNGDSRAVNNIDFSSNVNNDMRFLTLASMDNEVLQKENELKLLEQATGMVSAEQYLIKAKTYINENMATLLACFKW